MKPSLLSPPIFKVIGAILLAPGLVFAITFLYQGQHYDGPSAGPRFTDEIAATLLVTALIFIGFSKLKNESEQTYRARLSAMYWSTLINCAFFITFLFFNSLESRLKSFSLLFSLLGFILEYNLFLLLFLFIARFYYLLFRLKQEKNNKELYLLPYKSYYMPAKIISALFGVLNLLWLEFAEAGELLLRLPKGMLILIALCFSIWLWAKEKNEDDFIRNIRLKAMQTAVYICYGLFIVLTWLVYGFDYLGVLYLGFLGLLVIFLLSFIHNCS